MKRRFPFAVTLFCLSCAVLPPLVRASAEAPNLPELQQGWKMAAATSVGGDDARVSQEGFDASKWYEIKRMPATVLQVLDDNGVYKDLYFGMNLAAPGDLWKQDWWYRTVPADRVFYSLIFKGLNYRADIWLNGHQVADRRRAVKLWPINEYWYFHAGANEGNNTLDNVKRVLDKRYGQSSSAEEFSRKAQLAHYEDVRAQYETYGTHWQNRKMTVHWMMNNPWPSVFGHLFDYYFKQGGGYFGAKKGLRPSASCGTTTPQATAVRRRSTS